MNTYDPVRHSLRVYTLFIACLNIPAAIFKVGHVLMIINVVDQYNQVYMTHTIYLLFFGIVANITIASLAFSNSSELQHGFPTQIPYLIGLFYTIVFNLIKIIRAFLELPVLNSSFFYSLLFSLLPGLFCLAIYSYAYYLMRKLKSNSKNNKNFNF